MTFKVGQVWLDEEHMRVTQKLVVIWVGTENVIVLKTFYSKAGRPVHCFVDDFPIHYAKQFWTLQHDV